MRTYCLACRKHIQKMLAQETTMKNKIIKNASRCGDCLSDNSRFMKQKHNKKVVSNIIKQTY